MQHAKSFTFDSDFFFNEIVRHKLIANVGHFVDVVEGSSGSGRVVFTLVCKCKCSIEVPSGIATTATCICEFGPFHRPTRAARYRY